MVNCDSTKQNVSAYIENQLDPNDRRELEAHLNKCPACKSMASRVSIIQNTLSGLPAHQCSENFYMNLRRKINEPQNRNSFGALNFRKVSYGFSFAVILLVFVVAYNSFSGKDSDPLPVSPQIQTQSGTGTNQLFQGSSRTATGISDQQGLDIKTVNATGEKDSTLRSKAGEKNPRMEYVDQK